MNPADRKRPPAVDFKAFALRVDADESLMRELAQMFIAEYPKQLGALQGAVTDGDAKRIRMAAHSIRGTALNFSASPAAAAAENLERLSECGDLAGIVELMNKLIQELHRVHFALEKFLKD